MTRSAEIVWSQEADEVFVTEQGSHKYAVVETMQLPITQPIMCAWGKRGALCEVGGLRNIAR